jgi:hypothetical protein
MISLTKFWGRYVDPNNLQDSLAVPEEPDTDSDITGGECSTIYIIGGCGRSYQK